MENESIRQKFTEALDALVAQVKEDRSVLAVVLCGSLSHDAVWAKSDIDLVLVTTDDKKVNRSDVALYADGVNVHAFLLPRAEFRKMVEGSVRNSFMHSFLAKGRLLYTHDRTIADLCTRLGELGERDTQVQLLRAATHALPAIYKAHKWFVTRGDLDYTALWILAAATPLAQIEVIGAGLLADREVIPQAM
jgi:predicted nucleotidyltransferase